MKIKDSIIDKQSVSFILDKSTSLDKLISIDLSSYESCIIFCDKKIKNKWWSKIQNSIAKMISINHVEFCEAGESIKNIKKYSSLVEILSKHSCSRNDIIFVIGGGTIIDAISFLSSTYMRGIPLFIIPTTLIGQADASTAGKTCLNSKNTKNLLGTYYLGEYVYNNIQFLKTNSDYDLRQGYSEIFKYALLGSKDLVKMLVNYFEKPSDDLLINILIKTIEIRLKIRKDHPLASNFGHTFGHALEKYSNYSVNHGDAISVGMLIALEFSSSKGLIDDDLKINIIDIMKKIGLNRHIEKNIDSERFVEIMLTDKKSTRNQIGLVLIKDVAKPLLVRGSPFYNVNPNEMKTFLSSLFIDPLFCKNNHWTYLKNNNRV